MRSHLEALYAMAFDKMGIHWEYEPARFNLGIDESGNPIWYTPDFEISYQEGSFYVEIKPTRDRAEEDKYLAFVRGKSGKADRYLTLLCGYPDSRSNNKYEHYIVKEELSNLEIFKCSYIIRSDKIFPLSNSSEIPYEYAEAWDEMYDSAKNRILEKVKKEKQAKSQGSKGFQPTMYFLNAYIHYVHPEYSGRWDYSNIIKTEEEWRKIEEKLPSYEHFFVD